MRKKSLLSLILLISLSAFCQEKKVPAGGNSYKFNIGAGLGICKYNINAKDAYTNQDTTVGGDAYDAIRLHFDHTFGRRFALGFSYEHNGLMTKPNMDNVKFFDQISVNNISISAKFKFISRKRTNIYIEVLPVYSFLKFQMQGLGSGYEFRSNGFGYQTAIGWDQFFGDHFGIYLRSSYAKINYNSNNNSDIPNQNTIQTVKLSFNEFGMGMGLLFRF